MRIRVFLAFGLLVATALLHAQSDDENSMEYFPLVPSGNTFQIGLRYVGGPKVSFGQLGTIPYTVTSTYTVNPGDATGVESRTYNDGYVSLDARTAPNGGPVNDGLTDTWSYYSDTQVTSNGNLAFHAYNVSTLGAGFGNKQSSGQGWEIEIAHSFGKIAGRFGFSLVGGFSFTAINSKITGDAPAQLTTVTDVYSLNGQTPPGAGYSAPTTGTQYVFDANGNPVLNSNGTPQTKSVETSVLLGDQPTRTTTTSQTNVNGRWQIRGAYYTFRFGPQIELPVTERLKFTLGAGAAVIYAGTNYVVQESVNLPNINPSYPLSVTDQTDHSVWRPAYYADADAQYWLTERTGFFMGATFMKSSSYDQTVGGRTAQIDLGSTYGLKSGFTLRF